MQHRIMKWPGRGRALVAVVVLALAIGAAGCGNDSDESGSDASASGLGSSFDVASAGDVTLKLWWLGNLEAPGIEAWMDDMVSKFESKYPNVTVEPTTYDTNTWITTQQTACQAKSGPDLWYNWSGSWSLDVAWKGCSVPNEDVVSEADLAANPNVAETTWEDKTWLFPLYKFVYPVVVNLDLLEKAGVGTELPTTWEDYITLLKDLKAAGTTPIALGLKDGFGGEIAAAGQLEKQWVNDPDDLKQISLDGNFETDPGWTSWISNTFELKPYFNDDANSVTFAEALALWQAGKTAMVFGAPGVQSTIADAIEAGTNVAVMKMPAFGDGDWADSLTQTGNGFQVTQWSENKQVAGAFMAFLQEPDNAQALYEASATFPATTEWDSSAVERETDKEMLGWLDENPTAYWSANYTPVVLDVNGTFVVFQKMMADEIDAAGAGTIYQDVIEKWRTSDPDAVANFESWLTK